MDPTLHPYQQRVVDEKAALDEKISKLEDFVLGAGKDKFLALDLRDQLLLNDQHKHMLAYSHVLQQRIRRFYDPEA